MKNNLDDLFIGICNMLRNPHNYGYLTTEIACLSLGTLNQRIINADCSCVLKQELSQAEYEQHFEKLLTEFELINLIAEIKKDIAHIKGEKEDED